MQLASSSIMDDTDSAIEGSPGESQEASTVEKVEGDPRVAEEDAEPKTKVKRGVRHVLKTIAGMVIPSLTLQSGKVQITPRRNFFTVMCLYLSHSFSAWGDRMWAFVAALLLTSLYPGSLLLPAIHGFIVQLTVAIFGTVIGDSVDNHARMKVALFSLLIQNGLLCMSATAMALMFRLDWTACHNVAVFIALSTAAILLAAGANLATVANTISIEKDWIVVIADGNKDTLAVLNANMRRIDLCCKLLAPALSGVILQHTDEFSTTIIVAAWNIVSFFAELGLLWVVYRLIPPLAIKKTRHSKASAESDKDDEGRLLDSIEAEEKAGEAEVEEKSGEVDESGEAEDNTVDNTSADKSVAVVTRNKKCCPEKCWKLFAFFSTFKSGWKIYIRQQVALVGFSMASLYLTVLGFSGVTSSYLLTQGLRKDLIGVFQGVGAIFGVTGTILFPFLRKRFGTIRTGLFGISTQLSFLLFCLAAIIVPSNFSSNTALGYYSPDCGAMNDTVNATDCTMATTMSMVTIMPTQVMGTTVVYSTPTPTPSYNPDCMNTSSDADIDASLNNNAIYLLLTGIVCCRIGLWIFDLAVQQLVQEKVVEEERGVVSGVMNAMISVMDMLHYVLVIAAPRPEHFNILTAISFCMVCLGWLLYGIYVRKTRGHFFHFKDCQRYIKRKYHSKSTSLEDNGVTDNSAVS